MSPTRLRWSKFAIDAYKQMGVELRQKGYQPLRELKDPDCGSVLTFWHKQGPVIIQQTWVESGDIVIYHVAEMGAL